MSTKSRTRSRRRGRPEATRAELLARGAQWLDQGTIARVLDELELALHQIGDGYDAGSIEAAVHDHYLCREFVRRVREHDLLGLCARLAGGEMGVTTDAPEPVIPEPGEPLPHREPGASTDPTGQTVREYYTAHPEALAALATPDPHIRPAECPSCGRVTARYTNGHYRRHTRIAEGRGRVVCEGAS